MAGVICHIDTIFLMDGSPHYKIKDNGCCKITGKACKCGGWMHYQPIYGGYYYKCEDCLKEDI